MVATPITDRLHETFAQRYTAFKDGLDAGNSAETEYVYDGDPSDLDGLDAAPRQLHTTATSSQPRGISHFHEIEIDEPDTEVVLRRRDGQEIVLTIPAMTMGRVAMVGWHQRRIEEATGDMLRTTDPQKATRLAETVTRAQERMITYVVPSLPDGLFRQLSSKSFARLSKLIVEMQEDALNAGDEDSDRPNR